MLLAAAGQAAPYTYDSSATRKINTNNNNNSNNNNNVNNVSGGGPSTPSTANAVGSVAIAARPTTASSIASTAACAIMKTLSVRLHRGTEFIKNTVQKTLVMSAATPAIGQQIQPLDNSQSLKRKLTGAGGIMGSSSGIGSNLATGSRQFAVSQPYVEPTAAFLRQFTVAPTELHRSASARKRNPSTDSLLMDLCLFKPIRPMPITPIKINKARGFELKRPKFMPPAANVYSDADDDDDEEELVEEPDKEPEIAHKPTLSTLTLPQHVTASAFVPYEADNSSGSTQAHAPAHKDTKETSNTHTSDSGAAAATATGTAKPKAAAATKRRRRAPLLTVKRRRKTSAAKDAAPPIAPAPVPATKSTPQTTVVAPKRKRRNAAGSATEPTAGNSTTISPMRHSPPMTRQRARLQISASSN
ncbi:uncharacterized protein DDB_G0280205 [Drosophila innubila]|uniref:uncharacterized protein DDB_G0280205 n=1 Tax=Drosophila innubila TaxID=198719 RepID=UPI00148BA0AD|nr:uncharacterized protein DDB_G0280205 [Drosophila innubila]